MQTSKVGKLSGMATSIKKVKGADQKVVKITTFFGPAFVYEECPFQPKSLESSTDFPFNI